MNTLILKTGDTAEFFRRGRELAQLADQGRPLPQGNVVSFADAADMLKLLTVARLALFRSIKDQPGSISAIALRLQRDRGAVKRDVDALARAGLLQVEQGESAGHGRMKEVRVTAQHFKLEASLA